MEAKKDKKTKKSKKRKKASSGSLEQEGGRVSGKSAEDSDVTKADQEKVSDAGAEENSRRAELDATPNPEKSAESVTKEDSTKLSTSEELASGDKVKDLPGEIPPEH